MKEIKFRAWDKDNHFMVLSENLMDGDEYFFQFDNFGKIDLIQLQYTNIDDENKTAVIVNSDFMQYTGLKDKKGKEIYEGDIIHFEKSGKIYTAVVFWDDNIASFNTSLSYNLLSNEIIGNIYENKELLK